MTYKIAICDDEASQRAYVRQILEAWEKKTRHILELKEYPDAESFLFAYEVEKDFDILLLDVEMPGTNGIALAKAVRKGNAAVQIVFITGFYDYFSDGYDVSALHYLIKPVDERKLFPVLDKAANNLKYRERTILLSTSEADVKLPLAEITYIEAENVYVKVHTTGENYRERESLSRFSTQLDESFLKVHRSYIVNLKYIKKISRTEITLQNGELIPLSRGMYDAVHEAIVRYL